MSKKKRVEIKNVPLESVTVGKIKQNKHSLFFTIVIFSLFIALIYFLPDANKYYAKIMKFLKIENNLPSDVVENNNQDGNNNVENDDKGDYYSVDKSTNIVLNDLSFSDFEYKENKLVFNASNKIESDISLRDKNIFLHVYDENNNLISWFMLDGKIESGGSLTIEIFDVTNISKINIFENPEYFDSGLVPSENGEITLTCTNDEETIVYTFYDKKLTRVSYDLKFRSTSSKYNYITYLDLYNKYKNIEGIKTNIISSSLDINYKFDVDYNVYNELLEEFFYFSKDESVNKVNYIMKSLPYKCS